MADEESIQDSRGGVPGDITIGGALVASQGSAAVNGLLRWSVPWFKLDSLLSAAKGLLRGLVPIGRKKKK